MLIIGHRGARREIKGNTLMSIRYAIKSGVDMVELDVMTTRDGVPILYHGLRFSAWGRKQLPEKLTLKELKTVRPYIATLEEALVICCRSAARVNIDLKTRKIDKVIEILEKYYPDIKSGRDVIISSHLTTVLAKVHRRWPLVKLGLYNLLDPFAWLLNYRRLGLTVVGFSRTQHVLFQPLAYRLGLKTYVYTINNSKNLDKYAASGTWGVISDYPSKIIKDWKKLISANDLD